MDNNLDIYLNDEIDIISKPLITRISMILFAGFKIMFDLTVSLIGIVVLSPLLLIIAIAIKLDSKGPAIFKQVRTGKHGQNFTLYKFRTMAIDNDVYDLKTKDKYTRVGKILRKTSLDELPQLFNIAKLEMSFIGPRPWITDYWDAMNEKQRRRCDVRPGITGLAQVNGRNKLSILQKINYDIEYINNYSIQQDIRIIFLTIISVFKAQGVDAGKEVINNELKELKKFNKQKK